MENHKIIIIQKTQNIYEILDLSGPNICKRIHASLAGHILDALRRNNKTGVINSEFCIRL